jgi:hypothetical protein
MATEDASQPFIERPDEHEVGAARELYCWMPGSGDRECNGNCVSYDIRFTADQRFTTCMVLNTLRSIGLSLGMQANMTKATVAKAEAPKPPKVGP